MIARTLRNLAAAAALGGALFATQTQAQAPASAPPPVSPIDPGAEALALAHLYGGDDGESHVEMLPLPRTGGQPGRSVQTRLYATDVEIGDTLPGDFIDYHGVSTPRLLIVLAGQLEVGLGDGTKYVLSKGDIVLADDVTGRGHTSRTIGTQPLRILTVRLPATNSLAPKLSSCPEGMPADKCVSNSLSIRHEGETSK